MHAKLAGDAKSRCRRIHDWDARGQFSTHKLDINDRQNIVAGVDNCIWATRLVGSTFELVNGAATPLCGHVLRRVTVAASS